MATGDGVYISLNDLKAYGLDNDTATTPDDAFLSQAIAWAEQKWNALCGCHFDEDEEANVQAFSPFVDGRGWLHLFARERIPVTAVAAVTVRDLTAASLAYKTLTLTADNIILPPFTDPPRPDSAHVILLPAPALPPLSTGQLQVKWTYTGGYDTIPDSLISIIARLAWWHYKLREAPLGRVVTGAGGLGLMEIPLAIPADIQADAKLWQPSFS
jgi:hypothetical protein